MKKNSEEILAFAQQVRRSILTMTSEGGSAHIGSAFSIVDLLAVLYTRILKVDPRNPKWEHRDRFILSKGHAGVAVYATLAHLGFFSEERLKTYYRDGSQLFGHLSHIGIPGVEVSTGSLGHGLSIGVGMALSAKLDNLAHRVFVMMSDGEMDEGSNWEAMLFAAHHRLGNLTAIIDYNKIQSLGSTTSVLDLEPLKGKIESFGWNVLQIAGHDFGAIENALLSIPEDMSKPTCIIAETVKGKGVSFMESQVLWHYRTARGQEFELAMSELQGPQ